MRQPLECAVGAMLLSVPADVWETSNNDTPSENAEQSCIAASPASGPVANGKQPVTVVGNADSGAVGSTSTAWDNIRAHMVGGWLCVQGTARESQMLALEKCAIDVQQKSSAAGSSSVEAASSDDQNWSEGTFFDADAPAKMEEQQEENTMPPLEAVPLWNERAVLCVISRFSSAMQFGALRTAGGHVEQLTFFGDRVTDFLACNSPRGLHSGAFVFLKDRNGDEFYQVFYHPGISAFAGHLAAVTGEVQPVQLTDPQYRQESLRWRPDGRVIAYSSNRRNSRDMDIVIRDLSRLDHLFPELFEAPCDVSALDVDTLTHDEFDDSVRPPMRPLSHAEQGALQICVTRRPGYFTTYDWSADGRWLAIEQFVSTQDRHLFILDVPLAIKAAVELDRSGGSDSVLLARLDACLVEIAASPNQKNSFAAARFTNAPTCVGGACGLLIATDSGTEFHTLRFWDLDKQLFTQDLTHDTIPWDVEALTVSPDSSVGVFTVNEDGMSRLYRFDANFERGQYEVTQLDAWSGPDAVGVISQLKWHPAPEAEIGHCVAFTLTGARWPSDCFVLELRTNRIRRWTQAETAGLSLSALSMPKLIRMRSFDGLPISAWLYTPHSGQTGNRAEPGNRRRTRIPGLREPIGVRPHDGGRDQVRASQFLNASPGIPAQHKRVKSTENAAYSDQSVPTNEQQSSEHMRRRRGVPVQIRMHGGPEAQSRPTFDREIQKQVVELGIAVLVPNVRGSTGYGRTFMALDDKEKRWDSVLDVGAVLDWIDAHGVSHGLDDKRVAIKGVSYGGFMVLASLIAHGERLCAGVEIVGISNFVTFLEGTGAYRRDRRRAEYGDERITSMREFLQQISPLTHASKIRSPLLVGQGLMDPRVPAGEAAQIVRAVRANGVDCWYVVGTNEGHGFAKKENVNLFSRLEVGFLKRFLFGQPARAILDGPLPIVQPKPAERQMSDKDKLHKERKNKVLQMLVGVDPDSITAKQALDMIYDLTSALTLTPNDYVQHQQRLSAV